MMQTVPPAAQDASTAVSLATSIDIGNIPSDAALIAGIGGIATLTAGPVAGAAMTAIGTGVLALSTALQGLFTALGLYSTPSPTYNYCGLQRIGMDQIPYGQTDTANWIEIDSLADYDDIVFGRSEGGSVMPGGRPPYSPNASTLGNVWQDSALQMLLYCVRNVPGTQYAAPTRFEEYVRVLMLKNLQYWVNCWPTVPPQDLLAAAANVWHAAHSASQSLSFAPYEGNAGGPGAAQAPDGSWQPSLVSWILSGAGDSTGQLRSRPPITVNNGPLAFNIDPTVIARGIKAKPLVSTTTTSTSTKVAVAGAGLVGATALTIGAIALVKGWAYGQAAEWVWKNTGGKVVGVVKREARKLHR